MQAIQLGDEVQDRVTKFRGIATGRTEWLTGCTRWVVQPEVDRDGKIPDAQSFDEPYLNIIKPGKVKRSPKLVPQPADDNGGPKPTPRQY